jgi:hypothetical protein
MSFPLMQLRDLHKVIFKGAFEEVSLVLPDMRAFSGIIQAHLFL